MIVILAAELVWKQARYPIRGVAFEQERRTKKLRFHPRNVHGYSNFSSSSRSFPESRISRSRSRTAITLSLSRSLLSSHPPLSSISITREGESTDSVGGEGEGQFFRVSVRLRKIDAFRGRLTSIITVEPTKWNNTGDLSWREGNSGSLRRAASPNSAPVEYTLDTQSFHRNHATRGARLLGEVPRPRRGGAFKLVDSRVTEIYSIVV